MSYAIKGESTKEKSTTPKEKRRKRVKASFAQQNGDS
jgi:hypothetical protein